MDRIIVTFSDYPLVHERQQLPLVEFCSLYSLSDWLQKMFKINQN